jgi:hypothetical protein
MREIIESGPATTSIGQQLPMNDLGARAGEGRYSAEDDEVEKRHLGDTRKPKITLKMLNRLKMIRAAKKLEIMQKQKILGLMYAAPAGGDEESL